MTQTTSGRSCGPCTACCKPFAIDEIGKVDAGWCKHSIVRKGCSIYDARPHACRIFKCAWLAGIGDENLRPDRIGFLILAGKLDVPEREIVHIHFYEVRAGALSTAYAQEFVQLNVDAGRVVSEHHMDGKDKYTAGTRFSRHYSEEDAELIRTAVLAECEAVAR